MKKIALAVALVGAVTLASSVAEAQGRRRRRRRRWRWRRHARRWRGRWWWPVAAAMRGGGGGKAGTVAAATTGTRRRQQLARRLAGRGWLVRIPRRLVRRVVWSRPGVSTSVHPIGVGAHGRIPTRTYPYASYPVYSTSYPVYSGADAGASGSFISAPESREQSGQLLVLLLGPGGLLSVRPELFARLDAGRAAERSEFAGAPMSNESRERDNEQALTGGRIGRSGGSGWLRDGSYRSRGHGDAGVPEELRPVPRRRRRLPRLCVGCPRGTQRRATGGRRGGEQRSGGSGSGGRGGRALGAVTGHAGNGAAMGCGHRTLVRQRRGRQHGRLFVVRAATAVRRRLHAVHVCARQSGAGTSGVSRRAAAASAKHELDSAERYAGKLSAGQLSAAELSAAELPAAQLSIAAASPAADVRIA